MCGCAMQRLEDRTLLSAGDLDPTFGTAGLVRNEDVLFRDLAVQADGKIIAAGWEPGRGMTNLDTGGAAVVRYNPDGTLDTTFGRNGVFFDGVGDQGTVSAHAVAIQSDGKILVVGGGSWLVGEGSMLVWRLNADGTLDDSFGRFGHVGINPGDTSNSIGAFARAVVVTPDGKILVGGGADNEFAVARLNADGSLDTTFGDSFHGLGAATYDVGGGTEYVADMALQSDGSIVLGGTLGLSNNTGRMAVMRLTSAGTLDASFGTGASVIFYDFDPLHDSSEQLNAVAVGPDGKIVLGGYTTVTGGTKDSALARLHFDGTLDPSFGQDGKVIEDFTGQAGDDEINDLTVLPDGSVLSTGALRIMLSAITRAVSVFPPPIADGSTFVARFNPSGVPDLGFGHGGGISVVTVGNGDSPEALTLDATGNILVAGTSNQPSPGGSTGEGFMARFQSAPAQATLSQPQITLDKGILTLRGTERGDRIVVTRTIFDSGSGLTDRITAGVDGLQQTFDTADIRRIIVLGGAGDDSIYYAFSNSQAPGGTSLAIALNGEDGNDQVTVNTSKPTGKRADRFILDGGIGNDTLSFNDTVSPAAGERARYDAARLIGGAGDDILGSLTPNVRFDGGSGVDAITRDQRFDVEGARAWYDNHTGVLHVRGTQRDDVLQAFSPGGIATIPENVVVGVVLNGRGQIFGVPGMDQGGSRIQALPARPDSNSITRGLRLIQVDGLDGDDVLSLDGTGVDFSAFAANSGVNSASAMNVSSLLLGGPGNDALSGGAGNDTMLGGAGDDLLVGRAGHDQLFGGIGNDQFRSQDNESDTVNGGRGRDFLFDSDEGSSGDTVISIEGAEPIVTL